MQGKILINAITIEHGNIIPLLLKTKKWQTLGFTITVFGNDLIKKRIEDTGIISGYDFIELKGAHPVKGKVQFIFEALRRNYLALFHIKDIKGNFDTVYSISSVMDLVLFPYFLKRRDKRIRWVAVFDNVVPLSDPGNKLLRLLAWIFFQISKLLLRHADQLYAISQELKDYLISKGFDSKKIEMTCNAVEVDLIKQAKKLEDCKIDALFVGRINETKGIYDMLKVLKIVKAKYPKFQLAFMGKGDEVTEKQFRAKIKDMSLEENVQFLGYRNGQEKFDIIKSSKCFWFLSVSKSESFGIALLEAVCCGIPAFTYDLSPFRHIYLNGEINASAIGDYNAVAEKILSLFGNKNFENQAGKKLVEHYSWDRIAEQEAKYFITNTSAS